MLLKCYHMTYNTFTNVYTTLCKTFLTFLIGKMYTKIGTLVRNLGT